MNSTFYEAIKKRIIMKKLFIFALFVFFMVGVANTVVPCCAAMDAAVLAEVNGEIIAEGALQEKLKDIHKNKPQMRAEDGVGDIKILHLVEEIIDNRLMIQEAYRVELDESADFTKKIESYVTVQSILSLRKDEVLDKINISDQDIIDYFKEHYEKDGPTPEGMFEKVEKRIRKNLRKEKEKELSDNFVAGLRKKADIWIDSELFDLLDPEKNYTGKKSVVARVNGETIPLDDFLHDLKQTVQRQARMFRQLKDEAQIQKMRKDIKQNVMDSLITYKLIEQEALKRKYVNDHVFMDIIEKRKERLLIGEFRAKIIYPLSVPTKNELTQYYEKHIDNFKKGYEVRFSEMIFQQQEDAENAHKELKQGANFEFLAPLVSEKWMPRQGGVWVNVDRLSPAIKKEFDRMNIGQTSDVIADGGEYRIIKLKDKRGGEPIEFFKLVDTLKKIVGKKNFDKMLSEYLAKLRDISKIRINKKALKLIEKKYWKKPPKTQVST